MSFIKSLLQDVWSKIAAGEVVERPASAVKELVENSIDAGANQITVSLTDGGRLKIVVDDNGMGIAFDELPLAIEYHATSKIQNVEDLEKIATLGYRGEALASLVAVADVEIISKMAGSEMGGVIKTLNGKIIQHEQLNCNKGTRVQIDNLFGTLPARRKFLKSATGELKRCASLIREYAICRPDIIFTLENDGKIILSTDGSGEKKRVLEKLWGNDAEIQCVKSKTAHLNLECWFQSKYGRKDITAFVNSRAVNDNAIKTAVNSAARDLNGNWALFFTLEPSLVDVNIHPTKAEVRFRYPSEIYEAVKIASSNLGSVPKFITGEHENFAGDISNSKTGNNFSRSDFNSNAENFSRPKSNLSPGRFFNASNNFHKPANSSNARDYFEPVKKIPAQKDFFSDLNQTVSENLQTETQTQIKYLGQISSGYLIFDTPDELVIIDPHAAHERINYERIKNIAAKSENVQHLLIPVLLHPTLALETQEYINELNRNGFEIENTSNGLALKGVPAAVSEFFEPDVLLRMSLNALRQNQDGDIKNILWRTWATQACKMSVKLTSEISSHEALILWQKLNECEQPFTCPHGRPVALKISSQDFAKHFGRE